MSFTVYSLAVRHESSAKVSTASRTLFTITLYVRALNWVTIGYQNGMSLNIGKTLASINADLSLTIIPTPTHPQTMNRWIMACIPKSIIKNDIDIQVYQIDIHLIY